jgi:hypothetical protein
LKLARDVVLLVPSDDRRDTILKVDFDSAKKDHRILTVVADQKRKHEIIGAARKSLADGFSETASLMQYYDTCTEPVATDNQAATQKIIKRMEAPKAFWV